MWNKLGVAAAPVLATRGLFHRSFFSQDPFYYRFFCIESYDTLNIARFEFAG